MWGIPKIIGLLTRAVLLLEEQNALLRELHLKLTGQHAVFGTRPAASLVAPTPTRKRTGNDVWQRTPNSLQKVEQDERNALEQAAQSPEPPDPDGHTINATDTPISPLSDPSVW